MEEPIVFISHYRIRPGMLDEFRQLARGVVQRLETDKPNTVGYLIYLTSDGTQATFVHLFSDANAMDQHFEGARERSSQAAELMESRGWELYGRASKTAVETIEAEARGAGVALVVQPIGLGGFLRLAPV
jgi:hypothetical protein